MEPTAKRPRTDQQTPQNQLQQHTTTENNAALHKQQKHDGDVHVTPPTPIDGISGSGSVSVSGSSGDDGKLLPYNDTTDHRVLLSASYKCELVSSSVKGAFAYLNNLAADAETSAIAATADVDSTVNLLGSTMMTMISSKVEELKAEIQANLQSSLNQLKSLNTSEYLRNQRLICPKERLLNAFGKLLNDISILQGTHILDLPLAVLSMIIGYLPAQGVISTRAVCFKLWDAVRTVYGCQRVTLSTEAEKRGEDMWLVAGDQVIVTPCMDFRLFCIKKAKSGLLVYFSVAKKVYVQRKNIDIDLIDETNNTTSSHFRDLDENFLSQARHKSSALHMNIHSLTMGNKLRINVTVTDAYQRTTQRLHTPPSSWQT